MTNNISFGELLMFADIGRQNAIVANNRMPAVGAAIRDSLVKFGRQVVLTRQITWLDSVQNGLRCSTPLLMELKK
jgi:hypothetical protein